MMTKHVFFVIGLAAILVSCGSKTSQTPAAEESVETTQIADPTTAITQRIDYIWHHLEGDPDAQFCSKAYNQAMENAVKIADANGYIVLDADHYVQAQDIDEKGVSITVDKVQSTGEKSATVLCTVHNFGDRPVELHMVYEGDDWYIDDFVSNGQSEKQYLIDFK